MELSPADQLAHSTVRIECTMPNGGVSTGTGFFYAFNKEGDNHVPAIVTNRHVVEGAVRGRFLLTLRNSSGGPDVGNTKVIELDSFQGYWFPHPDPTIDLCVMPIAPLIKQAEKEGTLFFYVQLEKALIPNATDLAEMMGLASIVMIGYPNGLWDEANNLPIFRKGILASDYKRDWNGRKEFLIDAACFPGSSGSPVMLFEMGSYQMRTGIALGSRMKLLGILYAGPQHTVEGEITVVTVPTAQKALSVAGIPNNLGIVIKAEQLVAFDKMFPR